MTTTNKKTPCEEKGYKVGDWFVYTRNAAVFRGTMWKLINDDGTVMPYFQDKKGTLRWILLASLELVDKAEASPTPSPFNPLTARDRIKEIDEQAESLKVEREALVNQLDSEGFLLGGETLKGQESTDEHPSEDMTDPKNWRVGDLVVSLVRELDVYKGEVYRVLAIDGSVAVRDSEGDTYWLGDHQVKWHSRPKD